MQYELADKRRVKNFVQAVAACTRFSETFTLIMDLTSVGSRFEMNNVPL